MRALPLLLIGFLFLPVFALAEDAPFVDVPAGTEMAEAITSLKQRRIVEGSPDSSDPSRQVALFWPDEKVNRAEAVTIIVRAVANVANLPPMDDCFPDVAGTAWFVKPVCYAQDLEWVNGYPDGMFKPTRTVTRAEYLKILLRAYGADTEQFLEYKQPLSTDVSSADLWYYPYYAYAIATGMTQVDAEELLNPGQELTRGQVALLTYRFLLHREGKSAQRILINMERDIRTTIAHLEVLSILNAQFAVDRVHLTSDAIAELLPENSLAQASSPLALALDSLVKAFDLVQKRNFDSALAYAKTAFTRVSDADVLDASVREYTDTIRSMAHGLAESVREYQNREE